MPPESGYIALLRTFDPEDPNPVIGEPVPARFSAVPDGDHWTVRVFEPIEIPVDRLAVGWALLDQDKRRVYTAAPRQLQPTDTLHFDLPALDLN